MPRSVAEKGEPGTLRSTNWSVPGIGEAGFALPAVLLLLALLTAMLTVALTRTSSDLRLAVASQAVDQASVIARSGLQAYLGRTPLDSCGRAIRPVDGDSLRINLVGGYADVEARVVRKPLDTLANWLYLVRSTGHVIWPDTGSAPVASRTVAQFAEWQSGRLALPAALTAANGLSRTGGGSGQLHGADEHVVVACRTAPRRYLRVGGGVPSVGDFDLNGNPPEGGGVAADIVTDAHIDWAAVVTPGRIVPDFTTIQPDNGEYPIQFLTGNATLGAAGATTYGRGLLIVTGDLTILGSFVQWWGVVLVGGVIHFDAADQRFDGLVASGLNLQLGTPVTNGYIGGDYTDVDYNSLFVSLGMLPLSGFAPIANAYIEHWATY